MITEDYVSWETGKLMVENGFDQDYPSAYYDYRIIDGVYIAPVPRPTLQMAMKWLRETHNIVIYITPNIEFENEYNVHVNVKWFIKKWAGVRFKSYELACEAGIKYCLEKLI